MNREELISILIHHDEACIEQREQIKQLVDNMLSGSTGSCRRRYAQGIINVVSKS